jgi:glucan phosphorylase
MKHYLRDLFLAGLALLALSSCHSADPEKEAEKLNEQFTELINSIDTNASPYTRYKYLLKIKDTADSLFSKGRTGFKKKKLALYRQNVIEITDRQEYKDAWASMSEDNKAKMSAFPSTILR